MASLLMALSCQYTGHIEGCFQENFQVKALLFDLPTIPRVFTKTLAIVVHLFHNQGSMRFQMNTMTIHLPLDWAQELSIYAAYFRLCVITRQEYSLPVGTHGGGFLVILLACLHMRPISMYFLSKGFPRGFPFQTVSHFSCPDKNKLLNQVRHCDTSTILW